MKILNQKLKQKIEKAEEAKNFHWKDYKKTGFDEARILAGKYSAKINAFKEILELLEEDEIIDEIEKLKIDIERIEEDYTLTALQKRETIKRFNEEIKEQEEKIK